MAETMTLQYDLNAEDYAAFCSFHLQHSPYVKKSLRKLQFGLPAFMLVVVALTGSSLSDFVVWVALPGTAWVLGIPAFFGHSMRRRSRAMAEEGIAQGFVGPHRLQVDAQGILDVTPFYEHRFSWPAIHEVVLAPDHILLYTGAHTALIVPKRVFVSELAVGAFAEGMTELRKANIGPRTSVARAGETSA